MTTRMLLPLALLLVAASNTSSFRLDNHASLQVSPFGAVSATQQRVPLPPLFEGKDGEEEDDVDIVDAMDEVDEALKAAAEALGESPAEPTPPPTL
jgi:hypothetical protein